MNSNPNNHAAQINNTSTTVTIGASALIPGRVIGVTAAESGIARPGSPDKTSAATKQFPKAS